MPSTVLHESAASLVGHDAVRPGAPGDAVDGVIPHVVVEPATADAVGAILGWASREKLSVLVRGSGTKLGWGPAPRSIDLMVSTVRLGAVVAHRHGDLTATIQSGATLGSVNRALARHRSGFRSIPGRRSRHYRRPGGDQRQRSTPASLRSPARSDHRREFARADGRLAKGGGIVVKNVAGYDLPRLMTGSFGSLGVIVAATFKLYPLTRHRSRSCKLPKPADLGTVAGRILSGHLTPTALAMATIPCACSSASNRFEASVEQQSATAGN